LLDLLHTLRCHRRTLTVRILRVKVRGAARGQGQQSGTLQSVLKITKTKQKNTGSKIEAVRVKEFLFFSSQQFQKRGGKTERFTLIHSLGAIFWSWLPCKHVVRECQKID